MKPGNGYTTLKPKDWTPPRQPLPYGPAKYAVELMAQARRLQLQSEHEAPRRTYPQQSHIGRIFIPSSMCPLCIEQKRQKARARELAVTFSRIPISSEIASCKRSGIAGGVAIGKRCSDLL